ncbi:MAG: S8 family serine peptidase [Verrucomicrobiales bacterium]|nr:S8 family serine peptidase [Verrucomicrobiales bacterium]
MSGELSQNWPDLSRAREVLQSATGAGVKVAVIDSGIDVCHEALKGAKLEDDLVVSCDGINLRIEENHSTDVYGHGTAVASLLLKEAPGITLGSFRALDSSNHARSFVIAECVNQAISLGYQVINCSFGCRGLARYVMDYKEWVDRAFLEGVQIVAACSNVDAGIREWPAYFPSVISVRGIDCGAHEIFSRKGRMVSFLARGERVEVPWLNGETKTETGSSYAAPLVAGKIARLLEGFPDMEKSAIKPLLSVLATPEIEKK